jgi:hypothetical protein
MRKLLQLHFTKILLLVAMVTGVNTWGQATLPFSYDGGIPTNVPGLTQDGLGTDYASSPKLKFDTTSDNLVLRFGSTPGVLGYKIKWNPASGTVFPGFFRVQQSVDGVTYTDVKVYGTGQTSLGSTLVTESSIALNSATRYVKWIYSDKTNGNIAIGAITVSAGVASGPTATTVAASGITASDAILNGSISAAGNTIATSFQYGLTTGYGSTITGEPASVTGSTATPFTGLVSALTPNTLYHYRAVGTYNTTTVINGNDMTFYTLANVPQSLAINGATTTTLSITVDGVTQNNNPAATLYSIQETGGSRFVQANGTLGTTEVYQTAAAWGTKIVTGLTPGTTYTFRARAKNLADVATAFGPTAQGATLADTTLSAVLSGTLNEPTLNGASFTVSLNNTTFVETLTTAEFVLHNAPAGVTISTVTYVNPTTATVVLAYNNADFDTQVTNVNVTIGATQTAANVPLTSGNITISSVLESLTVSNAVSFTNQCTNTTTATPLSFTITGANLKAGNVVVAAVTGFTYATTANGTYAATLTIPVSAGAFSQVIYVKFTPVAAQTYSGSISVSVSDSSAVAVTTPVSGTGFTSTGTATTNSASSVTTTGATLNGTFTVGTCTPITEKGFVYSVTATNGTPTVGAAGVTKVEVPGLTGSSYNYASTGLTSSTGYSYRAYVYNGTNYIYGSTLTFTTLTPAPVNDLCANATELTVNNPAIQGTLRASTYTVLQNGDSSKDVWYTFTTSCAGTHVITLSAFSGDADLFLFGASCPTDVLTYIDFAQTNTTPEVITATLSANTIYKIRVTAFSTTSENTFNIQVTSAASAPGVTASVEGATFNTATVNAVVSAGCGNTTTARGITYSTTANPTIQNGTVITGGAGEGAYSTVIAGLTDNKTYYVRAYATNAIGTTYSSQVSFTTANIPAPVALEETALTAAGTGFAANWTAVESATGYRFDLSTTSSFNATLLSENFSGFLVNNSANRAGNLNAYLQAPGWTGTFIYEDAGFARISSNSTAGNIITPAIDLSQNGGNGTFTFEIRRFSSDNTIVQVFYAPDGVTFNQVGGDFTPTASFESHSINLTGGTSAAKVRIQPKSNVTDKRFYLDNISVSFNNTLPDYNNITVNGTSKIITGLTPGAIYYYRVRAVGSNGISANSNVIAAAAVVSNVWTNGTWSAGHAPTSIEAAIIASPYNTVPNGELNAASLTVNTGASFTVASNTSVTIQNEIVNNAGAEAFVVQNNGNLLQVNNTVSNVNAITVHRNSSPLFRQDYTMWSSPVAGQNLQSFSDGTLPNRFYVYDTANNAIANSTTGLINIANDFEVGKGYLIRMPNDGSPAYDNIQETMVYNGTFIGEPNNGTIPVTLSGAGSGFNLIGNPYPSPIRITDFFAANNAGGTNKLEGTIWIWRKKNNPNNNSSYITINSAGIYTGNNQPNTTTDPQGIIRTGQGFIVKPLTLGGPTTIEFNNAMRSTNTSNTFFRTNDNDALPESHGIWLNLTSENGVFSQMYTGYIAGATSGFDNGLDSRFINDSKTVLASVIDNEEYVIQGRALPFSAQNTEALQLRTDVAGTYTITLDHVSGLFEQDQDIYIKDNVTGTVNRGRNFPGTI